MNRVSVPDFVIIGAMKAGTTTVWEQLSRHPQVFMCRPKEPQFFSRDHVFARGPEWYEGLFAEAAKGQLCGEASTCYSRWPVYPRAAERLAAYAPGAKLIYILRHPVERLYSHYLHAMTRRFAQGENRTPSLDEFLEQDEDARCASRYSTQIEHLLEHFDWSQLLLVLLDDLQAEPSRTLRDVQRFLGIEESGLFAGVNERANSTPDRLARIPKKLSQRWVMSMRRAPVLEQLIDVLPIAWRRRTRTALEDAVASSFGRRIAARFQSELPPFSAERRRRLCLEYAGEAAAIGALLDRDLTAWLQ